MISRKAFMALKRGDIVLYGVFNTPRIVEIGPANWRPALDVVVFSKLSDSWTKRADTWYGYTDVKDKLCLPRSKRDKHAVRRMLNQRLRDMGYNPKKELLREAAHLKRGLDRQSYCGAKFICSVGHSWPAQE